MECNLTEESPRVFHSGCPYRQASHPSTYRFTSFVIPSHQKFLITNFTVFHYLPCCNDWPHCLQVFYTWTTSFFILLHISNRSVSASLVGHVLYSADLMAATCIPHIFLMVHRYIYSRYSLVFLTLYQLYHSLPSSTLNSSSSLYLKLQPELLLKVVTHVLLLVYCDVTW